MRTREKLEHKLEKRHEWAEKAESRAAEEFQAADKAVEGIPFGQPIMVGHHSERMHRRAIERAQGHSANACAEYRKAKYHEDKARGLERRLENTIFSDDEDAVERLQAKLDDRRKLQDGYKKINKIIRSKITPAEKLKEILLVGIIGEETATELVESGYTLPAYMLTNNNSEIRRIEKRIEEIKRRAEQQAAAEQAENGVLAKFDRYGNATVTFAEKPDYEIIRALKDAGFYWSRGSWHGDTDRLPQCVRDLLPSETTAETTAAENGVQA